MGWGDELMVTAQAKRMQARDPRPVVVLGRKGPRWHPAWDNNPRIARPGSYSSDRRVQLLDNGPGRRPYLDYRKFRNNNFNDPYVYTDFRVEPGEIYLSDRERELGRRHAGAVILEPHVKPSASPNKDWGWNRWQRLADALRGDLRLVQLGPRGTRLLRGVELIETGDIREAGGVLSGAALLIAPEGGLHHAAAALGRRAVVIFGGFISPETTGYELHANLFTGGRACGMRVHCAHCVEAMARISPAEVLAAAHAQLGYHSAVAA